MKNYTTKIKVDIKNIYVTKDWFSFDYYVFVNGKLKDYGNYDSRHSRNPSTMRSILKKGYAAKLALERVM